MNPLRVRLEIAKALLVVFIVTMVLLVDLSSRKTNVIAKINRIIDYEQIETPKFLRGLYVPVKEKRIYEEIDRLVAGYENYGLINLTNSGLFSLYKRSSNQFHKMYVDWGMVNSYLYPDYIPKLQKQIRLKSDVIFSGESLTIDGYVPVKVFPELNGIGEIAQPTIIHVPGIPSNIFDVAFMHDKSTDSLKLKLIARKKNIIINSIVINVLDETDIPKKIQKNEFEYNILPRILSHSDQIFVKDLYYRDDQASRYLLKERIDKKITSRLIKIFSSLFLYEKFFQTSDTFKNSKNGKIEISVNGCRQEYKERDSLDIGISKKNIIDLLIPAAFTSEVSIFKLRINYNNDRYHEENFTMQRVKP